MWFPGVCATAHGGAGAAKKFTFSFAFISPLGIIPTMKATIIKKLLWLIFYSLPVIAFAANLTEPRAEVVPPLSPQNISMPVKVIIYKSRRLQLAGVSEVLGDTAKRKSGGRLGIESVCRDPGLKTWS